MAGGNDSHNWVVPVDSTGYADYAKARSTLALPLSALRSISAAASQTSGRQFAFASDLEGMRNLYEQRQLAVMANVGPLLQPTTKAQFDASVALPPKLFSHNDQQSSWQALAPEGARAGWGGRIGDLLMSANDAPAFTTVSATGNAVFLSGATATQYQISTAGAVAIGGLASPSTLGSTTVAAALLRSQFDSGSNPFQTEVSRVVKRSVDAQRMLATAAASVSLPPIANSQAPLSNGSVLALDRMPLAQQLRAVAQMIASGQKLGMRRQVFMVSMGGFDTHANQVRDQTNLMGTVSQSVSYFMDTLRTLGMVNNVTLFTASDFGRTLSSNGSGSDHGWGSHHFVAGGAVKGGDIYGRFPVAALGTSEDVGSGRLLPSTSVTEYAATLARWMGVSATDLPIVLPNVGNFGSSQPGFL
jgi:uncharacterized protein (DUF1501 family)